MENKLREAAGTSVQACAEEGGMCRIRQIIHKLLASICHMGILLLFLGFLPECALSYMISLSLFISHRHMHTQ